MNKLHYKSCVIITLLILSIGHSATITWTKSTITGNVSEVLTEGTMVQAVNMTSIAGVTANPTLTFAGTTFTSSSDLLDKDFDNDTAGGTSGNQITGSTVDYDAFLSRTDYATNGTGALTLTTFTGLTIGNTYKLQTWYLGIDTSGLEATRTMTLAGAGDNVIGSKEYGIGTFVADATTQDFIITASQSGVRTTGFQLRETAVVPEPSSLALLAIGLTSLAFMRRRRA